MSRSAQVGGRGNRRWLSGVGGLDVAFDDPAVADDRGGESLGLVNHVVGGIREEAVDVIGGVCVGLQLRVRSHERDKRHVDRTFERGENRELGRRGKLVRRRQQIASMTPTHYDQLCASRSDGPSMRTVWH